MILALYEQRGPGRWLLKPLPPPATARSRLPCTAPQHHCWESLTFNDLVKRSSYLLNIQWSNPCLFQSCCSGPLSLPERSPTDLPAFSLSSLQNCLHISISVSDCAIFLFKMWACFFLYNTVHAVPCLVTQSCLTLCDPMNSSPPASSLHGHSPGKNTRVSCLALLQGIRVSHPVLTHWGEFFTIWATREAQEYWSG